MTDILSSNNTGGGANANSSGTTVVAPTYEPRPSTRVRGANLHNTVGDGDVWYEHLVVCEAAGNKLVIRSYFKNGRTHKKVWDEPPTGASTIEPASSMKRTEAETELKTLQAAMDGVSADAAAGNHHHDDLDNNSGPKKSSKKGRSFFGAFRKKTKGNNNKNGPETASSNAAKIGGMFGKSTSKKSNSSANNNNNNNNNNTKIAGGFDDMDGDEDIQRAISLSMGLQQEEDTTVSSQQAAFNKFRKQDHHWQEDQEALEMAKAISMSEAEATYGHGNVEASSFSPATVEEKMTLSSMTGDHTMMNATEEEMLQRAIEESRREHTLSKDAARSYGVAAKVPSSQETDLIGFFTANYDPGQAHHAHPQQRQTSSFHQFQNHPLDTSRSNDDFLDQKLPAKPTNLKKPPPTAAAAASMPNNAAITPPFASMPTGASTMSFDPYAQYQLSSAAPAKKPADDGSYSQISGGVEEDGPVLRKMDDQDNRKPAASLGRLMYNKKSVEDEAGVG